jgi:outer membrane immunogenic protein
MKKLLLASVAIATLTGSAFAADLPTKKAPPAPPAPAPIWTGFYAGLNFGGGWNTNTGPNSVAYPDLVYGGITTKKNNSDGFGGVIGGLQVGYNYEMKIGNGMGALIGAEADFQGTGMVGGQAPRYALLPNINTTDTTRANNNGFGFVPGINNSQKSVPWFGTVRGRIGLTVWPSLLVYGTGGFAYADVQRNNGGSFGGINNNAMQTGWTAGGGLEWMFMQNLSAKVEYLYTAVSGGNQNTYFNYGYGLNNVNNITRWNTIRAGVNYHFNFTPAPAVVAKY